MTKRKLEQGLCQMYCQCAKQEQLGHSRVADKSPAGQGNVFSVRREVNAFLLNKNDSCLKQMC